MMEMIQTDHIFRNNNRLQAFFNVHVHLEYSKLLRDEELVISILEISNMYEFLLNTSQVHWNKRGVSC